MNSSLVTDLGLGPEVWLFLSLLGCVTLFFKFSRFWSVRNLDLLLALRAGARDDADRGQPATITRGVRISGCFSGRGCG